MPASFFTPEHIPESGSPSRVADRRAGVCRLDVPVQPHYRAQTAEVGAAYQQMFCIANDLKAAVAERDRALVAVREAQRRTMRQLVVIAARREAGGLEHCLRVGAISALLAQTLGKSMDGAIYCPKPHRLTTSATSPYLTPSCSRQTV